MSLHTEINFENDICAHLAAHELKGTEEINLIPYSTRPTNAGLVVDGDAVIDWLVRDMPPDFE